MDSPFSSFSRLSRSLARLPSNIIRRSISRSSRSSPCSRLLTSRESISPENGDGPAKPLLTQDEISIVSQTLNRALKDVDFGNEIVIRLLNDKRSLFKSLLARCASQAHEIVVFDVQSLARFCPRAVQVGDGVTRFFKRVAIVLEQTPNYAELEQILSEMCRANGQLHYRMKVWFQAENWLCVKHSVVDTVLMANSNLKCGKKLRSAGDVTGRSPRLSRHALGRLDTFDRIENVEMVWMKLMQAVIAWMKQGFLEAAMGGKEEQDEEL